MSFIVNTSPFNTINGEPQPIPVVEAIQVATSSPVTKLPPSISNQAPLGSETIRMLIDTAPRADALTPEKKEEVYQTIKCESGFDPQAKGDYSTTTQAYTSFGTVQIHLSAHPDITIEQAHDPVFSIWWMVEQFANHKESMWSCWKNIYQSNK